ncbi:GNAT family N-acetyltransferase [Erwinia sp. S63]|nr:GNAT family N-acetyltransferase [Erwinia sp. S63]
MRAILNRREVADTTVVVTQSLQLQLLKECKLNLRVEKITPDIHGFSQLKAESIELGFNMLRRLDDNWRNGTNRFDLPGEKLLGLFSDHELIGVGGLNQDPFMTNCRAGRVRHLYLAQRYRGMKLGTLLLQQIIQDAVIHFAFINTHAPGAAFSFYERAGFHCLADQEISTHRLQLIAVTE